MSTDITTEEFDYQLLLPVGLSLTAGIPAGLVAFYGSHCTYQDNFILRLGLATFGTWYIINSINQENLQLFSKYITAKFNKHTQTNKFFGLTTGIALSYLLLSTQHSLINTSYATHFCMYCAKKH